MMTVARVGPRQYRVESSGRTYWVDLDASDAAGKCDCPAGIWTGHCKHITAVERAEADRYPQRGTYANQTPPTPTD